MVGFQLQTNATELMHKYYKRADSVARYARIAPQRFAMAIHVLRKANLEKMVYSRTPYAGSKRPPTRDLYNNERVLYDTAYNGSKHAKIRHDMKGSYTATGQSRKAEWVEVSVNQFRPAMVLREQSMNRNILEGKVGLL